MNIDEQRIKAMNICIDIANDYSEDEVRKFTPPSVQRAWQIGSEYLDHAVKEQRNKLNDFTI